MFKNFTSNFFENKPSSWRVFLIKSEEIPIETITYTFEKCGKRMNFNIFLGNEDIFSWNGATFLALRVDVIINSF